MLKVAAMPTCPTPTTVILAVVCPTSDTWVISFCRTVAMPLLKHGGSLLLLLTGILSGKKQFTVLSLNTSIDKIDKNTSAKNNCGKLAICMDHLNR